MTVMDRSNRIATAFVVCGTPLVVSAQPIESLTFSIEWDKAVIAPGETNIATIYATIGPEIGTTTAWNSKPGQGQPAVLKALASLSVNFKNQLNGTNGSISWKVNPTWWQGSGAPPTSDGQSGIEGIFIGQLSPPGDPNPHLDQTIAVATVNWVAAAWPSVPYEVLYETKAAWAKVYLDPNLPSGQWVGEDAVMINGQGGFMVIPASSSTGWLVPLLLAASRRRRSP